MKIPEQIKKVHELIDKELPRLLLNGNDFDFEISGNCSHIRKIKKLVWVNHTEQIEAKELWKWEDDKG